ncbi:MAG: prepilin peptidase [Neomegalonema sp.]|nr:prepilin peptidase [Neomegalonema sp.]
MHALLSSLLVAPLPFALALAAASDVRAFKIPNQTTLLCAVGALPALLLSGLGSEMIGLHLAMGAGGFALGFILFAFGLWGGGDGKLLAATALWFDPGAALPLILAITLVGGALGLIAIGAQWFSTAIAPFLGLAPLKLGRWATEAPYGLAIAIGALIAFPQSALYAMYFGG